MDVLLDTHALLWFYGGDESLPVKLREQIKSFDNRCYLSVASLWEISIKVSLGKLELGTSLREFFDFIDRNNFQIIPIEFEHLLTLQQLPLFHKDPFDRIIIAQALTEQLTIASKDRFFQDYALPMVWE
ncbi:PIN domain nuclease [Siphonobacter sp. BAB-5385]|uniref:type II toxin-antitoxin system VapC family toxin n=1 Tax=Siphonobacter sp. BAB-5385 TaxID=1864822 RepID=UPI000B9E1A25|nr:type II toxin-antitoxin system VapC family toxin [Siphonobacter sp. BAB-5385]OZI08907.1 PIN domain nuclease [Siphonobacter sp. BAB-5385]